MRILVVDMHKAMRPPWLLVGRIVALSLAAHMSIILALWCIGQSLALSLTLAGCLVMMPPILVMAILPISVGGWGVREGAMVVGLGVLGVPSDGALALSLLFGIANLILSVPGIVLWLASRDTRSLDVASGPGV